MRAVIVAWWLVTSTVALADDKPLKGNVLVWADARWYLDGHEKAVTLRLGDLGTSGRKLGAVLPAKVIATRGDFIELELGGASDCAWSKVAAPSLATLRLFVKREDLANVLAKPFAMTHANGSRISLMAGVPIEGGRISITGDELELAVPATSIGLSYPTPRLKPRVDARKAKQHFSVDGDVLLGDTKLATKQIATKIVKRGANVLFPLQAPCIDALVVAPKAAVSSSALEFGTAGVLGLGAAPIQERWYIAKGTPMLSPSGRVIAKAREDIDIMMPVPGTQRVCHEIELDIQPVELGAPRIRETVASERTLELCVSGDKVKHQNPTPPKP